jgi:Holliday junction DNA helicase RuvA
MIGYLQGKIISKLKNQIIVKTPSGIGYLVFVSTNISYHINDNIEFFIYNAIRENVSELYGFESIEDREFIEDLLKVSGVGPKMASLIIHTLGSQKIKLAIRNSDADVFIPVKGLGQKTAKKIILELKGALTDLEMLDEGEANKELAVDFTDALSSLGFKRGDIVLTISKLKKMGEWNELNLSTTVKAGIKILSEKKSKSK